MNPYELARLEAKTVQQRFSQMLQYDFNLAPKIAQVIMQEAEQFLSHRQTPLKVGQIRVVLANRHAKTAQAVTLMDTVEVTWTLDAGLEDLEVRHRHGPQRLRQLRIQRLLTEALDQGAIATQEDLARVLNVTVRTIKRDFVQLHAQGLYLPSRGYLHGTGRGQTHKARIIKHWLEGQSYDQIAFATHHAFISIQRYILTFVRVVHLHQQQFDLVQIAQLVQIGQPLVREYLALYHSIDSPPVQARLQEQIERLSQVDKKGGQ
jgi:hypothetical protein